MTFVHQNEQTQMTQQIAMLRSYSLVALSDLPALVLGCCFHQLLGRNTAKRHFSRSFTRPKLSVDGLVAISCSHSRTRALVPRPSSTVHARLSCFQYTDNVIEATVRLSPTQIIAVLLNYRDTAQLYS